jgi:hypothetical protein
MADAMLTELYKRVFETKAQAEALNNKNNDEHSDRLRQVAIAKNGLLSELINIRTEQLKRGNSE